METWLKQSTAITLPFGPMLDSGDGDTEETGLTISQADIRVRKNGGSFAQTNNAAGATHDEKGWYAVPLNTTDTGTLGPMTVNIHESGALVAWRHFMVVPSGTYDALFTTGLATKEELADEMWDEPKGGHTDANSYGKLVADIETDVTALLAGDIGVIVSGTSDSGNTTTMVDAARTEADDDYWNGCWIRFTSGNIIGQVRLITDFDEGTDTITFTPATTQAVAAQNYSIIPAAAITSIFGAIGSVASGGIVAASFAADAINAAALAADAAVEIAAAVWDRVLTGATHNIATSAGRRLRQLAAAVVLTEGVAQAGANGSITLAAGENANNSWYQHALIILTDGTGAGQARSIHDYTGSSKVVDVVPDWVTNPAAGTTYEIFAFGETHVHELHAEALATINAEVDTALNTAVPGTPTANSINQRVVAIDDLSQASGAGDLAAILGDTNELQTDDVPGLIAALPTAAAIVNEWETQSQADPTGFHVNVLEVGGTSQTANDNGADINAILVDTNELQGDWKDSGRLDLIIDAIKTVTDNLPNNGSLSDLTELATAYILATGAAESGTTTTMVDLARTENIDDYWNGCWIVFTNGNIVGQVRLITDFDHNTDTITFTPPTARAVTTQNYKILPATSIGDVVLTAATLNKIADGIIRRDLANAEDSSNGDTKTGRSLLGAASKLTNKVKVEEGILTVYESDDSTELFTQGVTEDALANPITALDTV